MFCTNVCSPLAMYPSPLVVIALLAAIVVPILPRGTSRARLESYAVETAALLKTHLSSKMPTAKALGVLDKNSRTDIFSFIGNPERQICLQS